ncbi:hypothetical protein BV22DRAFT_1024860, partial [Leucogyrophana mollusca]
IGQITMDNASNNNTLMEEIEGELTLRGIPFDRDGNRLRYVVVAYPTDVNMQNSLKTYAAALANDPVGRCREIVAACRVSGQRRHRLKAVIKEGNEKGYWKGKLPDDAEFLPVLELLRDCITRWSSTDLMVDRFLLLHPAIHAFLAETLHADITHLDLTAQELAVLRDIHQVLEIPRFAQELLSAERTPTLSMALPSYELLMKQWKCLRTTIPELSHYIDIGLDKIDEYTREARKTRIYALAMIINPSIKLDWLTAHWSEEDTKKARSWMLDSVGFQLPFLLPETHN